MELIDAINMMGKAQYLRDILIPGYSPETLDNGWSKTNLWGNSDRRFCLGDS